jgi:transketolase
MNNCPIAMRDALLKKIHEAMSKDGKIFFVTADFGSPVVDLIKKDFPSRFVNVGIAEQNLINISSGLAIEGYKVFAYAIAPFITMRCYEQIRVNLALLSEVREMNVTLIGVGAGYSYVVSGPTHQCYEDLTIMRALPTFSVYSPADHITTSNLFNDCYQRNGLKYLRLDAQVLPPLYELVTVDWEKGFHQHNIGCEICLVATGYMVHTALKVAKKLAGININVGVIDLYSISDFQQDALLQTLGQYKGVVTIEEGFSGRGGVDSLMFDFLAHKKPSMRVENIGVSPGYRFELGTRDELHEEVGIGEVAITDRLIAFHKNLIEK